MNNLLALCLIAAFVIIAGAVIIYGRSLVRIDLEKKLLHRRRVEDAEREETMGLVPDSESMILTYADGRQVRIPFKAESPADDDTRTWPKMPGVEP